MTSLLNSLTPTSPNAGLCAALWATVERSVLIGDLYAGLSPSAQDLALDCGWELSAWAERLESSQQAPQEWLSAARAALEQARAHLAELAPLG
tara:strand:+ start:850 stop:1128 length:279 start_codon:yes stop_codon:yes gene_type:complete